MRTVSFSYDEKALSLLPARSEQSHKGTFGRVLCVCGSVGMSGAAYLAGLNCGFWQSREDLPRLEGSTGYAPRMEKEERERLLNGWHRAVRAARAWAAE